MPPQKDLFWWLYIAVLGLDGGTHVTVKGELQRL